MSREFAKSEIIRQKCSICGMNNKMYTELIWNKTKCGYKLTCCNCSHVDAFVDDEYANILKFNKGREICIQLTTCKNRSCKYYGKYSLHEAADLLEKSLKSDVSTADNDSNNGNTNNSNSGINIENLNSGKLDINDCDLYNPRFH